MACVSPNGEARACVMIYPDYIDPWLAIPAGALALVLFFYIGIRDAPRDPNPELSLLDRADGLDSRTD